MAILHILNQDTNHFVTWEHGKAKRFWLSLIVKEFKDLAESIQQSQRKREKSGF